jgi:hypothetical protein
LWVVDTGKIGLATSPQVCPPKILIFNLQNNQLLHRYQIPKHQYRQNTLFINPVSYSNKQRETAEIEDKHQQNVSDAYFIHTFPKKSMKFSFSPLQIIDVNDPGKCGDTKAYIADVTGFSMLVYDETTNASWLVKNSMYEEGFRENGDVKFGMQVC